MKKKYEKPQIQVETFHLTQSVAKYCDAAPGGNSLGRANHWDISTCGWDMLNVIIWLDAENSGCTEIWPEDETPYGLCYNNPDGGNAVFGS